MSKFGVGLGSLGVALGLATAFAFTADAAPPAGTAGQPQGQVSDDLPNPEETKRRELREAAIKQVLAGKAQVQDRNGSKVVRLGKTAPEPGAAAEDQYVELAREKTDKIFVVLAEFGDERATGLPGPGHQPEHPGAGDLQRAAAQQDPGAGPVQGQLDDLAGGLQRRPLPAAVLRHGRRRRVRQDVLRAPVLRPLQRRRPGHRLGQGPLQRGPLRPQRRVPVRDQRLLEHVGPDPGRDRHLGRRPARQGPHRRRRSRPTSRPTTSGTATTSTTTATSTRPTATSTTSRSSTPAATRPTATPTRARTRSGRTAGRRSRTRARARRATRTAAPRSARPACGSRTTRSSPRTAASRVFAHEYGHDLGLPDEYDTGRRQRRQLVDADGPEPHVGRRRRRASAPARPTSAPGTSCSSAGSTTRSSSRARTRRWTSARTRATPTRRRASWSCCRRRR